ncbi:MAG: NAD(P)H-dependent oxidoreductase [Candidatus Peribacteria bacterium]|nr:MAG: NAD(P)H-dependent oxidoreductase [Candidatus Peribacteria bacterium]
MLLIIQTSLNPQSKTAIAAKTLLGEADNLGIQAELLDVRDYDFELCHGGKIESYNTDMQQIHEKVLSADAYVLAYPVYNYSFSGVCKNFIDIFSHDMQGKRCGVMHNSYSVRSFADGYAELSKVLGLHDHVQMILPVVHTMHEDFSEGKILNPKVIDKMKGLLENIS